MLTKEIVETFKKYQGELKEIHTIDALNDFEFRHDLNFYEMRFSVGIDSHEPKMFGVYFDHDSGKYIVYKNKADGSRAIRYEGFDEDKAVREIILKMIDELEKRVDIHEEHEAQKKRTTNAVISNGAGLIAKFVGGAIVAIIVLMVISFLIGGFNHHPARGYYNYNDTTYYYYDDSWYYYDPYIDDYAELGYDLFDDYDDAYEYYEDYSDYDFYDSYYYETYLEDDDYYYDSGNSNSFWDFSSWDSSDDDYDYDYDDSWDYDYDSGSSDWDSDW